MSNDSKQRIQKIIDLYLAQDNVDRRMTDRFRAWLESDGHEEEKAEAIRQAFDREVSFDPDPSDRVLDSYGQIRKAIGTRDADNRAKRIRLRRRGALRIAAVVLPMMIIAVSAIYMLHPRAQEIFSVATLADIFEAADPGMQ